MRAGGAYGVVRTGYCAEGRAPLSYSPSLCEPSAENLPRQLGIYDFSKRQVINFTL